MAMGIANPFGKFDPIAHPPDETAPDILKICSCIPADLF